MLSQKNITEKLIYKGEAIAKGTKASFQTQIKEIGKNIHNEKRLVETLDDLLKQNIFIKYADKFEVKFHLHFDGEFKIVKGKIKRISNFSGHYEPTKIEAEQFPEIFKVLNIDLKYAKKGTKLGDIKGAYIILDNVFIEKVRTGKGFSFNCMPTKSNCPIYSH